MSDRPRSCWQCRTYDREARRCRLGKTNPRKKHECLTVAELLGARALCVHNPHREPLLLRMRFPHQRFLWDDAACRSTGVSFEVELIEADSELNPSGQA